MLPDGVRRFFRLGRAKDVRQEVDAELAFHIQEKTAALIACGMREDDARAEAIRQFGDLTSRREELVSTDLKRAEQVELGEWWDGVWQDLRFAVRGLRRTPGLAAAVIVMLGLGIGGASAMYGLLDRLLLRVGPHVEAPSELRSIYIRQTSRYRGERVWADYYSAEELDILASALPAGMSLAGAADRAERVGGGIDDARVPLGFASGDMFRIYGTRPHIGRFIGPEDDQAGATPVAVLSYGFWKRRYAGSDDALGRTIRFRDTDFTIIGVAPKGFSGLQPERLELWVPMQPGIAASWGPGGRERAHIFKAVVRLPDGASPAALVAALQSAWRVQAAGTRRDTTADVQLAPVGPGYRPDGIGETRRLSLIVAGVALMLCFIAVANAANLLMLRAVNRRRETAVRVALGAGRARLIRAVVVESTLLAVAGGVAAGIVAGWGGELLRALIVKADWQQSVLDPRVILFAAVLALLIGIVTGLVPGWQATRADAVAALKAGSRAGGSRSPLRTALVAMQAALTVVLMGGLGLYTVSFLRAVGTNWGVPAHQLVNVNVQLPRDDTSRTPAEMIALTREIAARARTVPGVAGISLGTTTPVYGFGFISLRMEGVDSFRITERGPFYAEIDTAFLDVAGLTLLRGRAFTGPEVAAGAPVALVNDEMVARFWPGLDPIGKCLYVGERPASNVCRQVVGVVSSYRDRLDEHFHKQHYYLPLSLYWNAQREHSIAVRVNGPPDRVAAELLALVRTRLPLTSSDEVMAIDDIVRRGQEPWRNGTMLFGLFAGLAAVLAMGGLYSVVAYGVAHRAHEFGIRIAIGARGPDLVRLVARTALTPVGAGLVVGLCLTLWLVRYLAPLLYQTGPRDPIALIAATATMLLVAVLACIGPARRAAVTDPRQALQAD